MDYSFPRYLLSKQTVDDRALNKDVVNALRVHLPPELVSVIEIGAGIGTFSGRLMGRRMRYLAVEADPIHLHALRNRFLRTPNVSVRTLNRLARNLSDSTAPRLASDASRMSDASAGTSDSTLIGIIGITYDRSRPSSAPAAPTRL